MFINPIVDHRDSPIVDHRPSLGCLAAWLGELAENDELLIVPEKGRCAPQGQDRRVRAPALGAHHARRHCPHPEIGAATPQAPRTEVTLLPRPSGAGSGSSRSAAAGGIRRRARRDATTFTRRRCSGRSATPAVARASRWRHEARELPHAAALLRHAPVGGRLRHPLHPGTPGPQGRAHEHDLHARAQSRRARRPQPPGRPLTMSYADCVTPPPSPDRDVLRRSA